MTLLLVLRRMIALAIFIYLVVIFRRSARRYGRRPWRWGSIGVLSFYGTYFLVAIAVSAGFVGISAVTGGGHSPAERRAMPIIVAAATLIGIMAAFLVTRVVRHRLEASARTKTAPTEPAVAGAE